MQCCKTIRGIKPSAKKLHTYIFEGQAKDVHKCGKEIKEEK
jgi:hypothetical protein